MSKRLYNFIKNLLFPSLALSLIFVPVIIGLATGAFSILFTRLYHFLDKLMSLVLEMLSVRAVLPVLFASVALVGKQSGTVLADSNSVLAPVC